MRDTMLSQKAQQFAGAWQEATLRQEFLKQFFVSTLERISLGGRDFAAEFTGHGACEEPATHSDATMNAPTIDRHACLREGTLPREHMRINGVDESSVKIKDKRCHIRAEA